MAEQESKPVDEPVKDKEPVTGEVFVPTASFDSGTLDDDDAREQFVTDHKLTKAQAETVVMVGKQHNIGTGILYEFTAEGR